MADPRLLGRQDMRRESIDKVDLPLPVGEKITTHPFGNVGVVGEGSTPTICYVVLDEPLPHTDLVLSAWDEVQRLSDYEIADAQQWVDWAKRDLENANENLRRARATADSCRRELRQRRAELRKVKVRHAR